MSLSTREQMWAFIVLIVSILLLGLAPLVVSGLLEKTLPDSLIAVSDKTVTGLVGVLGTVAAMIFRANRVDEARAENTGKAFEAMKAAAYATPPSTGPQPVEVVNRPDEPVPVEPRP